MAVTDLETWLDEYARQGTIWYAKRLSGNDTLATGSHQAGPYIPKDFLFGIFPSINNPQAKNPDTHINLYVDSHADHKVVRVIWYNNALWPDRAASARGRNEARITRFGGQASALLHPDSTGSIAVFVFILNAQGITTECHVWVCDNEIEEEIIEGRIGPVEPKLLVIWRPGLAAGLVTALPAGPATCRLTAAQIPPPWLLKFPTGEEIVAKTRELRPDSALPVDDRLIRRRDCEFEIFKSVEEAVYLPRVGAGFTSIDSFISLAQTILQSRKSRSGTSLELHTRDILTEETFIAETHFSHRPVIEGGKRPDFLFPSTAAYNDNSFPKANLRMLAAKTTCKDRWRQVINEADRIETKHLLTLQEGVSENQFKEMREAGVQLVVPTKLHDAYPKSIRRHLLSLESFIAEVRLQQL